MIVFCLSDFDPAGYQMPISIGRKLQAFKDLLYPELEFEVRPIALTEEQAVGLDLPSTPLKESERRADGWREKFGREQTEIDALNALRPGALREIVIEAVKPYFDDSLDQRVASAEREWQRLAMQSIEETIGDQVEEIQTDARLAIQEFQRVWRNLNERLEAVASSAPNLPDFVMPEPLAYAGKPPDPLISSRWSWLDQTRALIARKHYGNDGGAA